MRSRLSFLACFVLAMSLLGACASTTVVSTASRPTPNTDAAATSEPDAVGESQVEVEVDVADDDGAEVAAGEPGSEEPSDATDSPDADESPRELEEAEGFGLGGIEQVASLFEDCTGGSDLACDVLYTLSAVGSPEEATARECGGRVERLDDGFCTEGFVSDGPQLYFNPASTGLPGVISECEADGNMTACDFLFFRSPEDSDHQIIGGTCGGRVQVAVPDCRTLLSDQ